MSNNAKPRVVTLCGSTRFQQAFDLLNAHLSLQGDIVISCGLFGHTDTPQGAKFLTSDGNESTQEKVRLDELHKRKIDLAECIYVVNVGGYIGSSTKSEIEYAFATGKHIYFMMPPAEGHYLGWFIDGKFFNTRYAAEQHYRECVDKGRKPVVRVIESASYTSNDASFAATIPMPKLDPLKKLQKANEAIAVTNGELDKDVASDLYTNLAKEFGMKRDEAKAAVFKLIYGAGGLGSQLK